MGGLSGGARVPCSKGRREEDALPMFPLSEMRPEGSTAVAAVVCGWVGVLRGPVDIPWADALSVPPSPRGSLLKDSVFQRTSVAVSRGSHGVSEGHPY